MGGEQEPRDDRVLARNRYRLVESKVRFPHRCSGSVGESKLSKGVVDKLDVTGLRVRRGFAGGVRFQNQADVIQVHHRLCVEERGKHARGKQVLWGRGQHDGAASRSNLQQSKGYEALDCFPEGIPPYLVLGHKRRFAGKSIARIELAPTNPRQKVVVNLA